MISGHHISHPLTPDTVSQDLQSVHLERQMDPLEVAIEGSVIKVHLVPVGFEGGGYGPARQGTSDGSWGQVPVQRPSTGTR